jgi:hypothetical protein
MFPDGREGTALLSCMFKFLRLIAGVFAMRGHCWAPSKGMVSKDPEPRSDLERLVSYERRR